MANNYYNPNYNPYQYNNYPSYQMPQQSYAQNTESMKWVEGEVGAKAFQMPAGWPVNQPIALWDSMEKKIYLKSWNQMGMANPLTELNYTIKDNQNMVPMLPDGLSGHNMSQYVSKEEFEELRQKFDNLMATMNANQTSKSRGGQQ